MRDTIEWKHNGLVFVLRRVPVNDEASNCCKGCAFNRSRLCWETPQCGDVVFKVKRVREDK